MASTSQASNTRSTWSDDQIERLLEIILYRIRECGDSFEKPTSAAFYRKILDEEAKMTQTDQMLQVFKHTQLAQKMQSLRTKYINTRTFLTSTGSGSLTDETIEVEIKKRCKFYVLLSDLYEGNEKVTPSYVYDSSKAPNNNTQPQINDADDDETRVDEGESEIQQPLAKTTSKRAADHSLASTAKKQRNDPPSGLNDSKAGKTTNALEMITKLQHSKMDFDHAKLAADREYKDQKLVMMQKSYDLELKKLEVELEKSRNLKEIELAKIESKERIKLAKLQLKQNSNQMED